MRQAKPRGSNGPANGLSTPHLLRPGETQSHHELQQVLSAPDKALTSIGVECPKQTFFISDFASVGISF